MNHTSITNIPPKQYNLFMDKPLRIAAYCRVSSLKESQELSLETQIQYYTDKIEVCIFVENAGVFSDTATGRNIRQLPAFKKLMTKCRAGKVNLILTKSISRFGRNSLETIRRLRELRGQNIDVYFEQENIHLLDPAAQHIIGIYCALAQNESENKSHNIYWGIHEGFRAGTSGYQNFPCYGYFYDKEKLMLKIDSKEAKIIQIIFDLRLQGYSLGKISSELAKRAILSPKGKSIWSRECIRKILANEKYTGSVLLQKTYVEDFFTGKQKQNIGQRERYLYKNNHKPIVGWDVFVNGLEM
ncbi:MAG: recombinase [Firmicutes bacterium]|nr:recombinase [Bacillota bacterium]